jgi:hypothetical protein
VVHKQRSHEQTSNTTPENASKYGTTYLKSMTRGRSEVPELKHIGKHFLAQTLSVEASTKTANCRILQTDNRVREGAFLTRHLEAVFSGRMLDCLSTRAVRGAWTWPSYRFFLTSIFQAELPKCSANTSVLIRVGDDHLAQQDSHLMIRVSHRAPLKTHAFSTPLSEVLLTDGATVCCSLRP